jgi:hypothetical protein
MISNNLCGPLYCNQQLAVTNTIKKIPHRIRDLFGNAFCSSQIRATITFLKIFRSQVLSPYIMTLHLNQENIPFTGCLPPPPPLALLAAEARGKNFKKKIKSPL